MRTRSKSHPLKFYTTASMESNLNMEHVQKIQDKHEEIKGRNGKYTAGAIVGYRPTRFLVEDGVVTLNGEACPTEPQPGGGTFEVVPKFAEGLIEFQKKHSVYESDCFDPTCDRSLQIRIMSASASISGMRGLSTVRGPLLTGYTTYMNNLRRRFIGVKASERGEMEREPMSSFSRSSTPSTSTPPLTRPRTPVRPITAESAQELIAELLDPEKIGTRGEAWFLGQLILVLLVVFPPTGLRQIVDVAGGCLILAGIAFITLGGLNLGQNLTPVPKPRDTHSLVTEGTYQIIRHPMYGGIILAAAGLALATGDEARLALTALTFYVLDQKATVEEEFLEERYPEEYAEYKRSGVKKLIPWLY